MSAGRPVMVVGVGLHPFGRFGGKELATLAREAVLEALKDSGVPWKAIPVAYFGHVYYHGMSVGETGPRAAWPDWHPHHQCRKRLLQRVHRFLAGLLGHQQRCVRPSIGLWCRAGASRAGDGYGCRQP